MYLEPTMAGSIGQPRGTVQGVYDQINADLEKATGLLQGLTQSHVSHIDYFTAQGIQARVALVQHNYSKAASAAAEALTKNSLKLASVVDLAMSCGVSTLRQTNPANLPASSPTWMQTLRACMAAKPANASVPASTI